MISGLDFIGIPSRDTDTAIAFYKDTLGLPQDDDGDFRIGSTCFSVWSPEKHGMEFVAQQGNPWALGVEDVAAARADLEAKGVAFFMDTIDTGVCHMALFADPDDAPGWIEAIQRLSERPDLVEALRRDGHLRASRYAWREAALSYLGVMLQVDQAHAAGKR